jgi:hypothetical protein
MQCGFTSVICPDLDEIREEDIHRIMPAIIAGVKYYIMDTMHGQDDAQIANLYYQRYYAKLNQLINDYPTQLMSKRSFNTARKWA